MTRKMSLRDSALSVLHRIPNFETLPQESQSKLLQDAEWVILEFLQERIFEERESKRKPKPEEIKKKTFYGRPCSPRDTFWEDLGEMTIQDLKSPCIPHESLHPIIFGSPEIQRRIEQGLNGVPRVLIQLKFLEEESRNANCVATELISKISNHKARDSCIYDTAKIVSQCSFANVVDNMCLDLIQQEEVNMNVFIFWVCSKVIQNKTKEFAKLKKKEMLEILGRIAFSKVPDDLFHLIEPYGYKGDLELVWPILGDYSHLMNEGHFPSDSEIKQMLDKSHELLKASNTYFNKHVIEALLKQYFAKPILNDLNYLDLVKDVTNAMKSAPEKEDQAELCANIIVHLLSRIPTDETQCNYLANFVCQMSLQFRVFQRTFLHVVFQYAPMLRRTDGFDLDRAKLVCRFWAICCTICLKSGSLNCFYVTPLLFILENLKNSFFMGVFLEFKDYLLSVKKERTKSAFKNFENPIQKQMEQDKEQCTKKILDKVETLIPNSKEMQNLAKACSLLFLNDASGKQLYLELSLRSPLFQTNPTNHEINNVDKLSRLFSFFHLLCLNQEQGKRFCGQGYIHAVFERLFDQMKNEDVQEITLMLFTLEIKKYPFQQILKSCQKSLEFIESNKKQNIQKLISNLIL